MLCKHLQFAYCNNHIAVGSYVAEHILIADAGVHASAVAEHEYGQWLCLCLLSKRSRLCSGFQVHRSIDHEVGQRFLSHGHCLVATTAAVFHHLHLLEADT